MLAEVRKCADNHDIKGLRYIFVDALDVDPTFDTYREDYEYCKTIPGMFDEHVNISPVVSDKSKWTTEYWEQLKLDLMKNFSEKRFEHMRLAAQVVYADKVSRLMTDRRKTVSASIPESVSKQPEIKTSAEASRKIHIEDNNNFTCIAAKPKDTTANQADLQKQRIDAQRRALETENRRIEAEQKKQREKIEAVRRAEANRQNIQSGGSESKKALGIALAVITIVVLVVLIIVVLH
jgi:hypothetical protein